MSEETKNMIVPKLRFPEFTNNGEWKAKPLSKELEFQTGFPFDSAGFNEDKKGIRLVKNRDLKSEEKIVYYSKPFDEKFVVNNGDILIGMDGDFTPCIWNNGRALLNQRVGRVVTIDRRSQKFSFYFLSIHLKSIEEITARTTVKHLSHSDVEKIYKPLPSLDEQQKIGDCLYSLDELITSQSQKLEALKAHKKGFIQQLFPAKGETVPSRRFKEFEGSGEWEEVQVDKQIRINSGIGFKASEYSNQGIRLLQIENVGYGKIKWSKNPIYLPESYSSKYPELLLKNGDIVLALNRPVTNNQLKMAKLQKCDEPCLLYQRVGKLELLSHTLISEFTFQLCKSFIKDFVIKQSIGSDQPFISLKELYSKKFAIPTPKEQQKIADCLSSLDELITAQTEKIEELKKHKKGLMQRLFPKIHICKFS